MDNWDRLSSSYFTTNHSFRVYAGCKEPFNINHRSPSSHSYNNQPNAGWNNSCFDYHNTTNDPYHPHNSAYLRHSHYHSSFRPYWQQSHRYRFTRFEEPLRAHTYPFQWNFPDWRGESSEPFPSDPRSDTPPTSPMERPKDPSPWRSGSVHTILSEGPSSSRSRPEIVTSRNRNREERPQCQDHQHQPPPDFEAFMQHSFFRASEARARHQPSRRASRESKMRETVDEHMFGDTHPADGAPPDCSVHACETPGESPPAYGPDEKDQPWDGNEEYTGRRWERRDTPSKVDITAEAHQALEDKRADLLIYEKRLQAQETAFRDEMRRQREALALQESQLLEDRAAFEAEEESFWAEQLRERCRRMEVARGSGEKVEEFESEDIGMDDGEWEDANIWRGFEDGLRQVGARLRTTWDGEVHEVD